MATIKDLLYRLTLLNDSNLKTIKKTICGKQIAQGCSRTVYECKLDSKWVVKIETYPDSFNNFIEWKVWQEICHWKRTRKYFAEVLWTNHNFRVLVMRKANMNSSKPYPKRVPGFFSDLHGTNYGFIGKRFVCVDYGGTIITTGWDKVNYKKGKWKTYPCCDGTFKEFTY